MKPIIVSVVMNAAIAMTEAPIDFNELASGNAIMAGMKSTEPISADIKTAVAPLSPPIEVAIQRGGIKPMIMPIIIMRARNPGPSRFAALKATFSARTVFSLLFKRERKKHITTIELMTIAVMDISYIPFPAEFYESLKNFDPFFESLNPDRKPFFACGSDRVNPPCGSLIYAFPLRFNKS